MKYRKLTELKKFKDNPRVIRDKQFKNLCQSIKDNPKFFEARPLILSNRTGELIIIAGNQRYEAAKAVGLKEAPTYMIEGLTEEQEKEITVRDNAHQGEWDFDILSTWDDFPLVEWGINELESLVGSENEKLKQEERELQPYRKTHVLISIDINAVDSRIIDLLDKLRKIEGIEIEQGSN